MTPPDHRFRLPAPVYVGIRGCLFFLVSETSCLVMTFLIFFMYLQHKKKKKKKKKGWGGQSTKAEVETNQCLPLLLMLRSMNWEGHWFQLPPVHPPPFFCVFLQIKKKSSRRSPLMTKKNDTGFRLPAPVYVGIRGCHFFCQRPT